MDCRQSLPYHQAQARARVHPLKQQKLPPQLFRLRRFRLRRGHHLPQSKDHYRHLRWVGHQRFPSRWPNACELDNRGSQPEWMWLRRARLRLASQRLLPWCCSVRLRHRRLQRQRLHPECFPPRLTPRWPTAQKAALGSGIHGTPPEWRWLLQVPPLSVHQQQWQGLALRRLSLQPLLLYRLQTQGLRRLQHPPRHVPLAVREPSPYAHGIRDSQPES
mmetsp:Transcript_18282/g.54174  ORF Transcript_18282/g.54174 Transcript_18282/m.54174 type:complete len:218 (-) Transcript_18282:1255-1908(-)